MHKLLLVAVTAVCCAVGVHGQGQGLITTDSCVYNYTDADGGVWTYNLTALELPPGSDYRGMDPDQPLYQYYINVCGTVACTGAMNAAACMMVNISGVFQPNHELGYYGTGDRYWDIQPPQNGGPAAGMMYQLNNGDACPGAGHRTTSIWFDCDPNAPDPTTVPLVSDQVGCKFDFRIRTPYACASPVYPSGPVTPGPGSKGLSGGSIFLIIFFVVGFVYVAGGCIFRRVSYGVGGQEACPNHEFWAALPGLVSDGAAFFVALVTCRNTAGGGSTQYENVK